MMRQLDPRNESPRTPVNPPPVLATLDDGVRTSVHQLHADGQPAVAWLEKETEGTRQLWISAQHSIPGNEAEAMVVAAVRVAAAADLSTWVQAHRDWWHHNFGAVFFAEVAAGVGTPEVAAVGEGGAGAEAAAADAEPPAGAARSGHARLAFGGVERADGADLAEHRG